MLSNSQIKRFRSLHIKKFRLEEKQFLIEGHRLIEEALKAKAQLLKIWCTENYINTHRNFIGELDYLDSKWEITSKKSIEKVCESRNSQGVIALLPLPRPAEFNCDNQSVLLLDNISDPGNMGTILRTAEWFGVHDIVLSPNCVDPYNSKVVRSSMGAHFHINQIIQRELVEIILQLKQSGHIIIGADMSGTPLSEFTTPNKWALVLGNEAHGLSSEIQSLLDDRITIPKSGRIESINVAVAGGVILERLK